MVPHPFFARALLWKANRKYHTQLDWRSDILPSDWLTSWRGPCVDFSDSGKMLSHVTYLSDGLEGFVYMAIIGLRRSLAPRSFQLERTKVELVLSSLTHALTCLSLPDWLDGLTLYSAWGASSTRSAWNSKIEQMVSMKHGRERPHFQPTFYSSDCFTHDVVLGLVVDVS